MTSLTTSLSISKKVAAVAENPRLRRLAASFLRQWLPGDPRISLPIILRWGRPRIQAFAGLRGIGRGSAVVWPEPGRAWLLARDFSMPRSGEVLVRIEKSAVSPGTERAVFSRMPNASFQFPYFPGYSVAGQIVVVGKGVSRFRPGDRVAAVAPHASVAVMREEDIFQIPEEVTLEEACFLEIGIICLQALRKAGIRAGEPVVVLGQGLIGQLLAQGAAAFGAGPVISVARTRTRVTDFLRATAHQVLILQDDGGSAFKALEAAVTFESTGNPDALTEAIDCTRPGGRIVLVGSPRGAATAMDFGLLADKEITIIGAHASSVPTSGDQSIAGSMQEEAELFLRLLAEGKMRVSPLISERLNPLEAEWFYRRLCRDSSATVGAIFCWDQLPDEARWHRVSYFSPPDLGPLRASSLSEHGHRRKEGMPKIGNLPVKSTLETPARLSGGQKLRIGLVGCGERGASYPYSLMKTASASLSMVMDADPGLARDVGERFHVPWTTSFDELLHSEAVDAVLICTPHYLHASQVIKAAENRKHIIVEKPLGISLKEAREALGVVRNSSVALSVIFTTRYLPQMKEALALIRAGAVGNILGVSLSFYHDKLASYWTGGYTGRVASDWRSRRETSGGGVLITSAIHYIDWLLYLTGLKVIEVSAKSVTLDSPAEVEDTISMWFTYDNGAVGTLNASSCVRGANFITDFRIWGRDGHIILTPPYRFYSLRAVSGTKPGEWHEFGGPAREGDDITEYFDRFSRAVLEDRIPEIDGRDGLAAQAVVDAAYRSADTGQPVRVEETA